MLKVHILTENRVRDRGLLGEHGLSLWIERGDKSILFDTGQSSVYYHNAKTMGINLMATNYIVISHGHYDHAGGLEYFPFENESPKIYIHPDAFLKKVILSNEGGSPREVGIPFDIDDIKGLEDRIIYTKAPLEIGEGILLSGEIPMTNSFEKTPKNFYIKRGNKLIRDTLADEEMLIIEDDNGIALFLGCSHPGLINSIKYAQKLVHNKSIKLLLAGMHLENASPTRLQMTIQHLLDMDIQKVVPLHCTGLGAMWNIKKALGDRCSILSTGDTIEL